MNLNLTKRDDVGGLQRYLTSSVRCDRMIGTTMANLDHKCGKRTSIESLSAE
jgi:hypothetical protein